MPDGTPQIGERWRTQATDGRQMIGVVADIAPNVVTLVSYTGNRVRLPPERFLATWHFHEPAPRTRQPCALRGCNQLGTIMYQRRGQTEHEHVCPRHLPNGVVATPTPEGAIIAARQETRTAVCPGCEQTNAVEDVRVSTPQVTYQHCQTCNARWGALRVPEGELNPLAYVTRAILEFNLRLQEWAVRISHITMSQGLIDAMALRVVLEQDRPRWLGQELRSADLPEEMSLVVLTHGAPLQIEPGMVYVAGEPEYVGNLPPRADVPIGSVAAFRTGTQMSASEVRAAVRAIPIPAYVDEGQRWVQRGTGTLMTVRQVARDETGGPMVRMSPSNGPISALVTMTMQDFLDHCSRFETPTPTLPATALMPQVGEEWEHRATRDYALVREIDPTRNLAFVRMQDGQTRSVSLHEFTDERWRKVCRRTAFDRIMADDD